MIQIDYVDLGGDKKTRILVSDKRFETLSFTKDGEEGPELFAIVLTDEMEDAITHGIEIEGVESARKGYLFWLERHKDRIKGLEVALNRCLIFMGSVPVEYGSGLMEEEVKELLEGVAGE